MRENLVKDGIYVGPLEVEGSLDLDGCTSLTTLPEGLSVGGWLDLRGCTSLTTLPEGLSVGNWLDLDGCTSLTTLPEGLSVGGWLDLDGCTSLTTLPEELSVGGSLDLRGCTSLTTLPEGLSVQDLNYTGMYKNHRIEKIDDICSVRLSTKECDDYLLHKCCTPKFKNGVLQKENIFYIAEKDSVYAHGESPRQAITDLIFKASDRDVSAYKNLDLGMQRSIEDLIVMYRAITGACSTGVERFIQEQERKESYSIRELLPLIEGRYKSQTFEKFILENS